MMVRLPPGSTRLHLLRTPIARTRDLERAERSRWTWGVYEHDDGVYVLTLLGVLHTLTGVVVNVEERPGRR